MIKHAAVQSASPGSPKSHLLYPMDQHAGWKPRRERAHRASSSTSSPPLFGPASRRYPCRIEYKTQIVLTYGDIQVVRKEVQKRHIVSQTG